MFKKKSEVEKLEDQYKKKMKEGYDLQSIDRSASDQKYVEADQILKKIELLEKKWSVKKLYPLCYSYSSILVDWLLAVG